jgi:ABC-type Zn uptake system ZnuABC Zn-binding protein ZnuA
MKKKLGRIILAVTLICGLFLCSCKEKEEAGQDSRLKVGTTIFPLGDIAWHIGGEKIDVITIMTPGASPHTFEPTFEIIRQAKDIKVLFKVGCGLDDWSQKVSTSLGGDIAVLEVSKGIALRQFEDGSIDPHYWLSLTNGSIIAKNIADGLVGLDPANKDYYLKNLAEYQQELAREDGVIKAKLANLRNKNFVTFHEAWFYYAQAYGLRVAEAFEPFPGKEPTAEFLGHFIETIKKNKITVVFAEPQFSPESIRQVAEDLRLKVCIIDPEGGGTAETSSYIDMMRFNTETIYKALSE